MIGRLQNCSACKHTHTQFGAGSVRSCLSADVKIHVTHDDDDDDAEMRNVKLSIITVAMILHFFDVWCCFE